jgi:2-polyprenyl-6-methoxyphenol hydroxylase-like FAD-dependent oxidoreductase
MTPYDVSILGHGIVGKTLALALAREGLRVAITAPLASPGAEDVRAYALNAKSVALLEALKVWPHLPEEAATPVYDMRVEGDAPGAALEFSAWQQGVRELAWIVDAAALEQELARVLQFQAHVTIVDRPVQARLEAICEGKFSARRAERGVQWTPVVPLPRRAGPAALRPPRGRLLLRPRVVAAPRPGTGLAGSACRRAGAGPERSHRRRRWPARAA